MPRVAAGRVLPGCIPDYYVIDWLPVYNFAVGVVSAFGVAPLLWTNSRLALPASLGIFAAHALVMLILLMAYRPMVAPDSLAAMSIRLAVWLIILALMGAHLRCMRVAAGLSLEP